MNTNKTFFKKTSILTKSFFLLGFTFTLLSVASCSGSSTAPSESSGSSLPTPAESDASLSPAPGSNGISTTPTLTWDDAAGEDGYTIEVDTANDFSESTVSISALVFTQSVPADTTSITLSSLEGGTLYFWRVIATNTAGSVVIAEGSFTTTATTVAGPQLAGLSLSVAALNPPFSPEVLNYTATAGFFIDTATATATASDPEAVIEIGTQTVASGQTTGPFALNQGETIIEIKVTAPDGVTQKIYTVTVTRALTQTAYIKSQGNDTNQRFGDKVAVDGNTLVVGVRNDDTIATGVSATYSGDQGANDSGAVFVYVRDNGTWAFQAYIKASNTEEFDNFGTSLAISGDTIVVGARLEDSDATTIDGDQTNNNSLNSGAAYVFKRTGSTWTQEAYLKASNADAGDQFGTQVAISGDRIVVSALGESSDGTGVNSTNPDDNEAPSSGAAYVFKRTGSTWTQEAYLKASNTEDDDNFGMAVAISGDIIVVGAPFEDSNAFGIGGDEDNNGVINSGAAYVFTRDGTGWNYDEYLKASNTGQNDHFGISVAISDDTIVIGALKEDSDATTIDGDQTNNNSLNSGAAYVFKRTGSTWTQEAFLKASNAELTDEFGSAVAISGDRILISAYGEASDATGVNGDQSNNNFAEGAGAAYLFSRDESSGDWSQQAYLKASNTSDNTGFGKSVSLGAEMFVICDDRETSNAIGINGDQNSGFVQTNGACYVF